MHVKSQLLPQFGRWASWARLASVLVASVVAGGVATSGCLERPLCAASSSSDQNVLLQGCTPKTTNIFVTRVQQSAIDKIDLLFMIDNSISMADKQAIMQLAVPDLVGRLVTPVCVPEGGGEPIRNQPGNCPDGYAREFDPINDIHIGVITSSLAMGADVCNESPGREDVDDKGWLLGLRPRAAGVTPPEGFLIWNPEDRPEQRTDAGLNAFNTQFGDLVFAVREFGCGYESSLESWLRFLVDPNPPELIQVFPCGNTECAEPMGRDTFLLDQRRAFLRPDSLVAIVMLSDENDCSIAPRGTNYVVAVDNFPMPAASAVCATNPNDPCCYSCALGPPGDCASPDPTCAERPALGSGENPPNLRCWEQKRRFGYDFLFPTERYVNALTQTAICPGRDDLDATACAAGQAVPNPLFADPETGQLTRSTDLVFLAGIVGVPWQDIQATMDADGQPYPPDELRYQTADQLLNDDTWNTILGDREAGILPADVLMHEARSTRGTPAAPPGAGYLANPINGHEWVPKADDDLMFACIFQLPQDLQRDCLPIPVDDQGRDLGCDCSEPDPALELTPLCQLPDGNYTNRQQFGKAYPGLRQLEVLKGIRNNAIVASICARNVDPGRDQAQDFGYRPAVDAIVDRLKEKLSGVCFSRELKPLADGSIPCRVIEATQPGGGQCDPARRRVQPSPALVDPALKRLEEIGICGRSPLPPCNRASFTLCEIEPAGPACQTGNPGDEIGWCYVNEGPLVEDCPATERRKLHFVDPLNQTPAAGSTALIACLSGELGEDTVDTVDMTPPEMPPPAAGDSGAP